MVDWKIKTLLHFFTTLRLFANAPHLPVVKLIHAYNLQQSKTLVLQIKIQYTLKLFKILIQTFSHDKMQISKKPVPMTIFSDEGLYQSMDTFLSIVNILVSWMLFKASCRSSALVNWILRYILPFIGRKSPLMMNLSFHQSGKRIRTKWPWGTQSKKGLAVSYLF